MDSSVSPKDQIWFLRVCHHISTGFCLCFGLVLGLLLSSDPDRYTGGSVAIGRVSRAGQVTGDDPDENWYPGPPGRGLGHEADNL
jgi:hypothetical protein